MKITISSPDGLGDFVLRVPMFRAFLEAGHTLQVMLREPALSLARSVLPEEACIGIEENPYSPETRRKSNPFRREQGVIGRFDPDVYVAAPFSRCFFDEVWLEQKNRTCRVFGFAADESGACIAARGENARECYVSVPSALPDFEKNRRLASAVLGHELAVTTPSLEPDPASRSAAEQWLAANGLVVGSFRVACVGGRTGLQMKDWGEENWSQLFAKVDDGTPIIFFGNTKESESIDRIRASLAQKTINTARAPLPIPLVLAVVAKSRGYVGRDSGIMHMAAATGRPVFALFSGGHWGRFLPLGSGVVVTANVPCRGCDFLCPHERAHCIRDVSLPFAIEAWETFLQEPKELIVREESLSPEVLTRIRATSSDHLIAERERVRRGQQLSRQSWLTRMKTFFLARMRQV